jgi:myo-inositol-1(or 4)-monophosphatase
VTDPLLLATAIEAVIAAGDLQMARFGTEMRVDKKGRIDLVTEVDLVVESMVRDLIAGRFPDHGFVAEEQSQTPAGGETSGYCWVFDPIDGTTNFAHGLAIFCASLGLEVDGRREVAAVYDPSRRELFTAERGGGAFLNGARLQVSATGTLIDALLVTGFPYDIQAHSELVDLFARFLRTARAVRRLGSAALDLCYVAAGRFDGFWEQYLRPWDLAAGSLIVEEAGGRVTGIDGGRFEMRAGHVLASNGRVHDEMLATIRTFEAERSRKRTP